MTLIIIIRCSALLVSSDKTTYLDEDMLGLAFDIILQGLSLTFRSLQSMLVYPCSLFYLTHCQVHFLQWTHHKSVD